MSRETRSYLAPIKIETREDGTRTLTGYASVFFDGTKETEFRIFDDLVERIMPGAFSSAIKRDDVRALFNHDPNMPLGRLSAGTLSLNEDKRGLRFTVDLPDTTVGRDVAESVSRGDIQGASFGFKVTDQEFRTEDKTDIREIRGVELFDVGPVTFPAYEGTTVAVRADDTSEPISAREAYRSSLALQRSRVAVQKQFRILDMSSC